LSATAGVVTGAAANLKLPEVLVLSSALVAPKLNEGAEDEDELGFVSGEFSPERSPPRPRLAAGGLSSVLDPSDEPNLKAVVDGVDEEEPKEKEGLEGEDSPFSTKPLFFLVGCSGEEVDGRGANEPDDPPSLEVNDDEDEEFKVNRLPDLLLVLLVAGLALAAGLVLTGLLVFPNVNPFVLLLLLLLLLLLELLRLLLVLLLPLVLLVLVLVLLLLLKPMLLGLLLVGGLFDEVLVKLGLLAKDTMGTDSKSKLPFLSFESDLDLLELLFFESSPALPLLPLRESSSDDSESESFLSFLRFSFLRLVFFSFFSIL